MRLTLYVKPKSREIRLFSEPDGTFTMNVTAPPERGEANREIVKWMSKRLGKSSSEIRIISGFHSNRKIIEILGIDEAEFSGIVGIPGTSNPTQDTRNNVH
jgi:uncharacterized protein (TIGR00251 family)